MTTKRLFPTCETERIPLVEQLKPGYQIHAYLPEPDGTKANYRAGTGIEVFSWQDFYLGLSKPRHISRLNSLEILILEGCQDSPVGKIPLSTGFQTVRLPLGLAQPRNLDSPPSPRITHNNPLDYSLDTPYRRICNVSNAHRSSFTT